MDVHVWVKCWNQEKRTDYSGRVITLDYEERMGFQPAEVRVQLSGTTEIMTGDLLTLKAFDGQTEKETVFVGKVRKKTGWREKGVDQELLVACDSRVTFGCTDVYALESGGFREKFLGLLQYLKVPGRCGALDGRPLKTEQPVTGTFRSMLERAEEEYIRNTGKRLYTHLEGADVVCDQVNTSQAASYSVKRSDLFRLARTEDAVTETRTRWHLSHRDQKTGPQEYRLIMQSASARWDILQHGETVEKPLTEEVKQMYGNGPLVRAAKAVRRAELSARGSWDAKIGRMISVDIGRETQQTVSGYAELVRHHLEQGTHRLELILRFT